MLPVTIPLLTCHRRLHLAQIGPGWTRRPNTLSLISERAFHANVSRAQDGNPRAMQEGAGVQILAYTPSPRHMNTGD